MTNETPSIAQLATALAKAQGEIQDAFKDKTAHNYNYADLSQVLTIARPVLSKNGLSVVQLLGPATEHVTLTTMLLHESGESITTQSSMPIVTGKGMSVAQGIGATCTYLRRYALSAMVGITQSDTDAAAESAPIEWITPEQVATMADLIQELNVNESAFLKRIRATSIERIQAVDYDRCIKLLETKRK